MAWPMADAKVPEKRISNPFASLKHKSFFLYWVGMCVSLTGSWMQNIAQMWLAYSLTESSLLLSLVGAVQCLPVLLFSLFAGVFVDRFPKKNILYFTQGASCLITLTLGVLVISGHIQFWHILTAALLLGVVNTFDMPTRQAFVIELVGKADLMNAITLNSTVFNLARMIGPALAGIAISTLGLASCFIINSVSFAAIVIVLFFVTPIAASPKKERHEAVFAEILNGLKHIYQNKALCRTILIVLILSTFAMNYHILLPVFAKEVLHQDGSGYGYLMSFLGVGSLVGAMIFAATGGSRPRKVILYVFPIVIAALTVMTGLSSNYLGTGLYLAGIGFFFVAFNSTSNTAIQLYTTDDYRGRVMSVYTLVFNGSTPIGNLYAGAVSDSFGSRGGFVACGAVIVVLMGILFLISREKNAVAS